MAKLQFPKSETNQYWDGREHDIQPLNLICLNETDYYYMTGYDNTFGFQMQTLLKRENAIFSKFH